MNTTRDVSLGEDRGGGVLQQDSNCMTFSVSMARASEIRLFSQRQTLGKLAYRSPGKMPWKTIVCNHPGSRGVGGK